MYNDVKIKQPSSVGIYVLKGKINEKYYWVQTDDSQAIWYWKETSSWKVGRMENLGTAKCGMNTNISIVTEYPYDYRNLWRYAKEGTKFDAPSGDVRLSYGGKQENW